ncbi:uncharacterized protein [Choristoneura fumiferana]|uniref:uncharacterized protein n=1 Tax=Choristoneura fumiferana TaxID=7141 RepID=UPI003D15CD59
MEVSAVSANDFFSKINIGKSFQEIVPYSFIKTPDSTRAGLLKRRKPLDKDALLSVKLDPAVLEAQVTVDTSAKTCAPEQDDPTVAKSKRKDEPSYPSFEEALSMQQAALLKLSPQQLELLMAFVDTLRRQRIYAQRHLECAFCKNNGSPISWYASHALRDRRRVRCPVLRALRCPRCGATGDRAHTLKYCPLNVFSDTWSCP